MDVLGSDKLQQDAIDADRVIHVQLHAGRCRDIFDAFGDLKDAPAALYAMAFDGRCGRQRDGASAAVRICDDQVDRKGVQAAFDTFHRGEERFKIDAQIDALPGHAHPSFHGYCIAKLSDNQQNFRTNG